MHCAVCSLADIARRRLTVENILPKIALFGTKNAYYSIVWHGIIWYCMELLCILWYCIVLHVIALYCMVLHGIVLYLTVLHGIALLASARGLYLARHLSTLCNKELLLIIGVALFPKLVAGRLYCHTSLEVTPLLLMPCLDQESYIWPAQTLHSYCHP